MRAWQAVVALLAIASDAGFAQGEHASAAALPDPFGPPAYQWAQAPNGRPWGSTAGIEIGPHGEVWAINRCGANRCEGSDFAPVARLDPSTGKVLASIGAGLFVFPHGLHVDRDGNVWVTDAASGKDGKRGEQVVELSPGGRVLMRLGTAGVAGGGPDHFNDPSDVVVARNGDIFVADGHGGMSPKAPADYVTRIVKFSKDGTFLKQWGRLGSGPGEFKNPHALAFDSEGRLFVADRGNGRLQIFSQDGEFLAEWRQFGSPCGLHIDDRDTLYVIDCDNHAGWPKGIRIGSAKTGEVTAFVPYDKAGEGVVVGPGGDLYGAVNVPPRGITRYARR